MKHIILAINIVFSLQVVSQTKCDIQSHYGDILKVIQNKTDDGKKYLTYGIKKTDNQYCFADYVKNNWREINAFITSFSSNFVSTPQNLLEIEDETELQSAFIAMVQKDSLFNAVMLELTAKVIDKTIPKDTITMNELLNIAVKFFYVQRITEDGFYSGKVCTGINGIKETEPLRKPFLEIFVSISIINHYLDEEYNMYDELVNGLTELYEMNLGVDKEERLLRARGAMFMYMFHNQKLRDMLLYEYENKKEYLSFVLRDT